MMMMKENTFIQWNSSQLWLLKYFHMQQAQLQFITSVSTAWFVDMWIWRFLLDSALENLFNCPPPPPPHATILCFMMRPRSRSQVKKKPTNTQVGYLKLLRQGTHIVVFLFKEASVTDIRCLSIRKSTWLESAVWEALQVMKQVTSLFH